MILARTDFQFQAYKADYGPSPPRYLRQGETVAETGAPVSTMRSRMC